MPRRDSRERLGPAVAQRQAGGAMAQSSMWNTQPWTMSERLVVDVEFMTLVDE